MPHAERYARQLAMPEIGEAGQTRLATARVLVAGLGGLGSAVSAYLAAAGVGHLLLADRDVVEPSNLNRQLLYGDADLGRPKAERARATLEAKNPALAIEIARQVPEDLDPALAGIDVVVDALDSFSARRALSGLCWQANVPLVHGAAAGFEGHVATILPQKTPCLGCLFGGVGDPAPVAIVGATAGLIGCAQAIETIKLLTGGQSALAGRLLVIDCVTWSVRTLALSYRPGCEICGGRR